MECEDLIRVVHLTPWARYTVYKSSKDKDPVAFSPPRERKLEYEDENHHLTLISGCVY